MSRKTGAEGKHLILQDLCCALYQASKKGKLGRNTILDQSSMSYKRNSLCLPSSWFTGSGSTGFKMTRKFLFDFTIGKMLCPSAILNVGINHWPNCKMVSGNWLRNWKARKLFVMNQSQEWGNKEALLALGFVNIYIYIFHKCQLTFPLSIYAEEMPRAILGDAEIRHTKESDGVNYLMYLGLRLEWKL